MTETIDIQALARGIHEVLILAVLRHGPKHGYQIALDVEEETGGVFAFQHGTLYPILHRLEKEGLIEGTWTDDGRRRKEYRLTRDGLHRLGEEAGSLSAALDRFLAILGEVRGGSLRAHPSQG